MSDQAILSVINRRARASGHNGLSFARTGSMGVADILAHATIACCAVLGLMLTLA